MDSPSEKAHLIASVMLECNTINELDQLTAEFNHMLPVLRDHIQRIEDIDSGLYVFGKEHPDGFVVYSMEAGKN